MKFCCSVRRSVDAYGRRHRQRGDDDGDRVGSGGIDGRRRLTPNENQTTTMLAMLMLTLSLIFVNITISSTVHVSAFVSNSNSIPTTANRRHAFDMIATGSLTSSRSLLVAISATALQHIQGDGGDDNNNVRSLPSVAAVSRREWWSSTVKMAAMTTTTTGVVGSFFASDGRLPSPTSIFSPSPAYAADSTSALVEELKSSKEKLSEIPLLLESQEWDKVRTILKTPPVNKLWNLGDSQNTILKLAKETGDVDLFELKDDLAYNLQMCDQLTYDNVFVYFQPGNGKIKIKEPQDAANKALKQLQQVIDSSQ